MQPNFRMLFPIPAGLAAECIVDSGDAIEVTARAEARVVRCPFCGSPSHPVRLVVASSMDGLAAGQGSPMAASPFRSLPVPCRKSDPAGGRLGRAMYLATLVCPTSMPSLSSSPWIRGAPHSGLARLMSRINWRISGGTFGRPPRVLDFQRQ